MNVISGRTDVERLHSAPISIVSYGCLVGGKTSASPVAQRLMELKPKVVICDESHTVKNPKAKRTEILIPILHASRHAFLISGTPALARPNELFTQLHSLYPQRFSSHTAFAKRYCNAHRGRFGWDYSGSSNLEELHTILHKNIMIRRLKSEVLTQLPSKRRQRVVLDLRQNQVNERFMKMKKHRKKMMAALRRNNVPQGALESMRDAQRRMIMEAYPMAANAKVSVVKKYVKDLMDTVRSSEYSSDNKIIIFAHHLVRCYSHRRIHVTNHLKNTLTGSS